MGLTRGQIKVELKEATKKAKNYDDMVHLISVYIFDNYKRRKVAIDSETILKRKKHEKNN